MFLRCHQLVTSIPSGGPFCYLRRLSCVTAWTWLLCATLKPVRSRQHMVKIQKPKHPFAQYDGIIDDHPANYYNCDCEQLTIAS